jgi:GNAT superfamily N-acetyltransferase
MRQLDQSDIELVCDHRYRMFMEAGHKLEVLELMTEHFRPWLERALADGLYFGAVFEMDSNPVASIGLMKIEWPPHPFHPEEEEGRGYVLNLFVEPAHRRKGIATSLMNHADEEFSRRGLHYRILHPTKMARAMYEDAGWSQSSEMFLRAP